MKSAQRLGFLFVSFTLLFGSPAQAQTPVGTGITYQGYLTDGGAPATGLYDIQFTLFDAESGGNPVGSPILKDGLYLTGGSFFATLDFGAAAFNGEARWVEIGLRPGSQTGSFTILTPRQPVTAAPYALYGFTAGGLGGGLVTTDPVRRAVSLQNSQLEMLNGGQAIRALTYFGPGGEGAMALWGPNNALNVDLSAASDNANLGYVGVADERGEIQAAMSIFGSGEGGITTWGPNDNVNVDISSDYSNPNRGFVGVGDADGVVRAGLYVDEDGDGIVFGDYKYFVVDHPQKPATQIVYVSLEGPEAGIYRRGVAKLEGGRATITLPEHFVALADPKSITVQLTPASFESKGVAFGLQPEGKIEIREMAGGTGSYDVHYLVHATRAAATDFQPVVANKDFKARFGRKTARQEVPGKNTSTGTDAKKLSRPQPPTAKKASR